MFTKDDLAILAASLQYTIVGLRRSAGKTTRPQFRVVYEAEINTNSALLLKVKQAFAELPTTEEPKTTRR